MPYYENTEDFIQPITIGGKRFIVKPNMVIYTDRELDLEIYSFLKKTDKRNTTDPIPLEAKKKKNKIIAASAKSVEELKSDLEKSVSEFDELKTNFKEKMDQLNTLHDELKSVAEKVNVTVTREQVTKILNKVMEETPQIEPEELERMAVEVKELKEKLEEAADNNDLVQLNDNVELIFGQVKELSENHNTVVENINVVFRRLEILKKVVKNLETLVYEALTDGIGVIDSDEDDVIVVEEE